jgi:hypothetical protein
MGSQSLPEHWEPERAAKMAYEMSFKAGRNGAVNTLHTLTRPTPEYKVNYEDVQN